MKKMVMKTKNDYGISCILQFALVRNEEKLVVLLLYSSFRRRVAISFRRKSALTSCGSQFIQSQRKWGVNKDSLQNQYSIMAQLRVRNQCDVTGLVPTEDVRSKYSRLETFSIFSSHAAISSIIKLHCIN